MDIILFLQEFIGLNNRSDRFWQFGSRTLKEKGKGKGMVLFFSLLEFGSIFFYRFLSPHRVCLD